MSLTIAELDAKREKALAYLKKIDILRKRIKKAKVKSSKSKGRPKIDEGIIEQARELAKKYPIPQVALALDISKTTLYNHGITRAALNKEK